MKEYYLAYENRYKKVYNSNMLWSTTSHTPEVKKFLNKSKNKMILDLGYGEGRDAISFLSNGYDLYAVDASESVINKCNDLSNNQFKDRFIKFDLIKNNLNMKFDKIYSIAVLHMFVLKEHRNKFWSFIRNHLNDDGNALITIMGDGYNKYESDFTKAYDLTERTILNNNKKVSVATTSCKIVNWTELEEEIKNSGMLITKKWISREIPEFDTSMCVIVQINPQI